MWFFLLLATIVMSIVLCLTIVYALKYFGIFEKIEVRVGSPPYPFGGQLIAYKKLRSCYADSSALFTEVVSLVPKLNTFGIYLDEPNEDNRNNCRFLVGVILNADSPAFEANKQLLETKGFACGQLPDVDHVVHTIFPFRSVISVAIAIRRVYPIIRSYIVEHNLCAHPAVEVYDENNIYFMFPLAKQNQFYQLYGSDEIDDSDDDNTEEDDEPEEEEKVIDNVTDNDDNEALNDGIQMRLRSSKSKKSSNSSTSSSFEELLADEFHKDS
ncbi:unnamed protein product [Medioppia subpectinata]|uniref:Testis-expressed sequence 264 protein n=1 Tax=Medioppia subpectinata TaxID=1979941 RepID=A0A7R9Q0U5_9ACAR|nr:unnamed protein product [Medioppia subpectinata]CAG2108481.1 unnamed protein product [Medioppia subpectinata]